MDKERFIKTIERLSKDEREVAIILYLKDIKDLLESLLEGKGIEKKHY